MSITPVFLDFETFWSQEFSLGKMTAIEYVTDPRFQTVSVAIKEGYDGETDVVFGEQAIAERFAQVDWDHACAIAHNMSEFDALVLAWRFGIKPRMWGCTLAMARPIHAKSAGGSLKALAKHYGLADKGDLSATNTKGKYLEDFTSTELEAMRTYNALDTEICCGLWLKLLGEPTTTGRELRLIDMTIRMLVEPQLIADRRMLASGLDMERRRKAKLLDELSEQLDTSPDELKKTLASTSKFTKLMKDFGVDVPTKLSPTTGKAIPALAKTDQGLTDLLDHPDERVSMAAAVRLDVRSTILETRIERFYNMAERCNGYMPIPLRYYGADTTGRWSGTMRANLQNLPRVNPKERKLSDVLRCSLRAPEGYKVVVADLSGIELRVNHFLWKTPSSMAVYEAKADADLYAVFAGEMYNKPAEEVSKSERQLAKVAQLGLGFGAGAGAFQGVARTMGGITLSPDEADNVVKNWRSTYPEITRGWRRCHEALTWVDSGSPEPIDPWGLCLTDHAGVRTPVGRINYPELRQEANEDTGQTEWVYGQGRRQARIYAGKVDENLVQHLARNVLADNLLEFADTELGRKYPLAHTVHDEVVYVVKDEDAQSVLDALIEIMSRPPSWWPELVTFAEGDIGQTYGAAK